MDGLAWAFSGVGDALKTCEFINECFFSDSAKRNVATSCSLKVSHPMGGLFPFRVVIAPYRLLCLGRSGRSQVLNVNDKFMRMNTTMCP